MLRVPGQVFAGQLAPDEFRIFGKEKNAPLQFDLVGALGNRDGSKARSSR